MKIALTQTGLADLTTAREFEATSDRLPANMAELRALKRLSYQELKLYTSGCAYWLQWVDSSVAVLKDVHIQTFDRYVRERWTPWL